MPPRLLSIAYLLLAPLITVQVRYLTAHYDLLTLWFYRYLYGAGTMAAVLVLFRRRQTLDFLRCWSEVALLGAVSAIICFGSVLFSEGVRCTNTATASVFGTMLLPISCLIASFLDRERGIELLRDPLFATSWVVIVLATVGFSLGGGSANDKQYLYGIGVLCANLAVIGVSSFFFKKILNGNDAWVISGMTIIFCFLTMVVVRLVHSGTVLVVPGECEAGKPFFILCFSGVYGILVGCGLHTVILKKSGLIVTALIGLSLPVLAAGVAFFLFGETLSFTQLLFGAILLCASYACLRCRRDLASVPVAAAECRCQSFPQA